MSLKFGTTAWKRYYDAVIYLILPICRVFTTLVVAASPHGCGFWTLDPFEFPILLPLFCLNPLHDLEFLLETHPVNIASWAELYRHCDGHRPNCQNFAP